MEFLRLDAAPYMQHTLTHTHTCARTRQHASEWNPGTGAQEFRDFEGLRAPRDSALERVPSRAMAVVRDDFNSGSPPKTLSVFRFRCVEMKPRMAVFGCNTNRRDLVSNKLSSVVSSPGQRHRSLNES